MSKWSLLILRSHVQRSKSNHSFEPSVFFAQYLLTPSLGQNQTWWRGCPQLVDDPYWFSEHVFKGQGHTTRSISFDPFTWLIPHLVQGMHPVSRWSLLIFRSHVQRSRLNHSFEPSVLSTLYILLLCLLASYKFCFYREDKHGFCAMGGFMFLKHVFHVPP